jgi:translation initiation factor IF-3
LRFVSDRPQQQVRLIGVNGKSLGVMTLAEAEMIARSQNVRLVNLTPTLTPPVYRLVGEHKFETAASKYQKHIQQRRRI